MIGTILAQLSVRRIDVRSLRYGFTIVASLMVGAGAFLTACALMMMISTTVRSASMNGIPEAGKPAPEFALSDLSGNVHRLADLHGKPAVIVFWAGWCPDCKRLIPDLNRMHLE